MCGKEKRFGFTLIEVLVVVAITSLLVAVMLPTVLRARAHARSSTCKSNCFQLGKGMTMYIQQSNCFPAHQWRLKDFVPPGHDFKKHPHSWDRVRWFDAMADMLSGYDVQTCAAVPDWHAGRRNNSYGYNYKYLGSTRNSETGPKAPWENFPVRSVRSPSLTLAFGDSDGTGWRYPHENGYIDENGMYIDVKNQYMFGNHGYTLDPTFIPKYSETTTSGGDLEPYAWHWYRTYISTRHMGGSNFCFADGHVEFLKPEEIYVDNRYWNGYGREERTLDDHVDYHWVDGEWRFPEIYAVQGHTGS